VTNYCTSTKLRRLALLAHIINIIVGIILGVTCNDYSSTNPGAGWIPVVAAVGGCNGVVAAAAEGMGGYMVSHIGAAVPAVVV
jgi:hypothetical protein